MAVDPAGKFLYVSNSTPALNGSSGGTDALTIDSTSGKLTVVPGSPFQDADSGFVTIDPSGKFLFAIAHRTVRRHNSRHRRLWYWNSNASGWISFPASNRNEL